MPERVVGIERHADLAKRADARLRALGYTNAQVRAGDGSQGLPELAELAPFDVMLVSAGGPSVPQAGGRGIPQASHGTIYVLTLIG